jgi:hypothetical protein
MFGRPAMKVVLQNYGGSVDVILLYFVLYHKRTLHILSKSLSSNNPITGRYV